MGLLGGGAGVLFDLLDGRGRRAGERVARRIEMAARRAVVATVVATTVLAVAGDHAAARVGRRHNETPGVKILTKDETAALARKRIDIRVPVRRPGRGRITLLPLNLGPPPAYLTPARTLNLDR